MLIPWLDAAHEQLSADLATALRTADGSLFQQRDAASVHQWSLLLIDALRADLTAGNSQQLRITLRTLIEQFGQQALRFNDLRLLSTILRDHLLTGFAQQPDPSPIDRAKLESWLFQVPLQAALTYIRQSAELIRRQHSDLELQAAEQRMLNSQLHALNAQQETLIAEQRRLVELIEEVSIPIASIFPNMLIAPLIGRIEARRAQLLTEQLLMAIVEYQADLVILDIRGVPFFDTSVARALLQATQAAGLLGAQVILVGISAEIAQTIVHLDIDLPGLVIRSTLQDGIEYALAVRGLRICAATPDKARLAL